MKVSELAELSDAELEKKLQELKEELFNLRFRNATGQLENPMQIRRVKRDIARVKTIQRQRQVSATRAEGAGR
ncbi:MAG: 50S ribosomal protein L29 [Clostridia bacterium]|nr:50S ribosomal protein L29 [Clostridia bacterium]